ncbi:hypothetical protein PO909_012865 [Leuciscus waleckii]
MVVWTDQERAFIQDIFSKLNYEDAGPELYCRVLIVYPWTQRYFGGFGNLYSAEAIKSNPMVAAHGIVVLHGLDKAMKNMDDITVLKGLEKALKNMDNIKNTFTALSELHSEKLQVDPGNFQLLGDCLTVVLARRMTTDFTPDIQAAWQKFLSVVISALTRQYY